MIELLKENYFVVAFELLGLCCLLAPGRSGKWLSQFLVAVHKPRFGDVPEDQQAVRSSIVRLVGLVFIMIATAIYVNKS